MPKHLRWPSTNIVIAVSGDDGDIPALDEARVDMPSRAGPLTNKSKIVLSHNHNDSDAREEIRLWIREDNL